MLPSLCVRLSTTALSDACTAPPPLRLPPFFFKLLSIFKLFLKILDPSPKVADDTQSLEPSSQEPAHIENASHNRVKWKRLASSKRSGVTITELDDGDISIAGSNNHDEGSKPTTKKPCIRSLGSGLLVVEETAGPVMQACGLP